MSKYKIGEILGSNKSLLILQTQKVTTELKTRLFYEVQCQICKNDRELHGDGIYLISGDYFKNGKLPCGCSKSAKYTEEQWKLLLKRKANSNNHEFIDFISSKYENQDTRLILKCNNCNQTWSTCTVSNYIKNRGCPHCAKIVRAVAKTTSDSEWIHRFRKTGMFPEENYSFTRISERGRLWKVRCNKCTPDASFVSDRSNLVQGKVPCNCSIGGGYDVNKIGYFYILKVSVDGEVFLKYGITNFYRRRINDHRRTLATVSGNIIDKIIFRGSGSEILAFESDLKRKIPSKNKSLTGFKKESCSIDYYDSILKVVNNANFTKVV